MIRTNTLANEAGSGPTALTGQAAARAYAKVNTDGTALLSSLNISSLSDDGFGDRGISFTNNFSSPDYAVVFGSDDAGSAAGIISADMTNGTNTAGGFDFETFFLLSTTNRTNTDYGASFSVFGDLA